MLVQFAENVSNNIMPRPTLVDVARAAGFSAMTVSRVLRGKGAVSPATKAAVDAALARTRYRPDPLLSALSLRRTRVGSARASAAIAILTPGSDEGVWRSVTRFAQPVAAAATRLEQLGYTVHHRTAGTTAASWAATLRILRARGVRGVLLPPVDLPVPADVDWTGLAGVNLGFGRRRSGFHTVRHDLQQMTSLALEQLVARGYRRIAVVSTVDEARSDYQIPGTALAAGRWGPAAGKILEPLLLPEVPSALGPRSRDALLNWITREKPDVLLSLQSETYHKWLLPAGWSGPEQFGLAVLNLNPAQVFSGPRYFAGVGVSPSDLGEAAARQLHFQILQGEPTPPATRQIITLSARWVDGRSLPARTA
jgi:LacI family transcriptional regulator